MTTGFQEEVKDWLFKCFGEDVALNKAERNHRLLEETLELVQAAGCTKEECLQLVDYVYGRPIGDIAQEVGGTIVCLAALCNAHNLNLESASYHAMEENWTKIDKIREKRKRKPEFGPLPK